MNPILAALMSRVGVHFMGVNADLQAPGAAHALRMAHDGFACDAQPSLITVSNSGIPAFLSTYVDPKLIEVLVAPMRAAEIAGNEIKKGDWTTKAASFPMVESTGETSSYGDYSESGRAGVNVNFPARQSYHYQIISEWGEKELEEAGLARIDWANRVNIAGVLTLNKFQNASYFFGVAGLQCYGLLNDPSLPASIVPTTKAATGTGWANATALEILNDVAKLYKQLQTQAGGLINLQSPMKLCMSPLSEAYMTKTTEFNVNVGDLLKKNYPNLKVETAPEYTTESGELLQLIAEAGDGQRTVEVAFTEKLRAHPVKVNLSSFQQKKSQGTWGAIVYRPFLIAQMLGV